MTQPVQPSDPSVTCVLAVTLPYEHQEIVLSRLAALDASFWSRQPGFVSSRPLRGLDGTRLAVLRTFATRDAYEEAAAQPRAREEAAMLARFGTVDATLFEDAR
jgi:hypothetical protein